PPLHHPSTPADGTLSLHDALPICHPMRGVVGRVVGSAGSRTRAGPVLPLLEKTLELGFGLSFTNTRGKSSHEKEVMRAASLAVRSEEHTSELQSRGHLVCRLLLER